MVSTTSSSAHAPASSLSVVLRDATAVLAHVAVPSPDVDAELLLSHVLGQSRGSLQAAIIRGDSINGPDAQTYQALIKRRATREPLQHIIGTAAFRHLELRVGPGVFVPRPETELVAQFAIDALRAAASPAPIGVDLGTGSGAIALSLATEVPHARVFAAENSPEAIVWTRENFERVAAANATLAFIDLEQAFPELDSQVSVLVSNPPYVPDQAIPRDPEVRLFDPAAALYGGADGLDVIRILSQVGLRLVHSGGALILEHGEWQGAAIREILTADGWRSAATHPDLTMRDRVTTATRP